MKHEILLFTLVFLVAGCAGTVEYSAKPMAASEGDAGADGADAAQPEDVGDACATVIDGAVCFCDDATCRCPSALPASYTLCAPAPHVGCGYPSDGTRSQICYPVDGRYLCEAASYASVWCAE